MLRTILFASGVSIICAGCTSISSTMLNRTDNDVFVGNSNGEPGVHCEARPFKGVPITLRVPTHLDVSIVEKIYLRKNQSHKLVRVPTPHRNLSVVPKIIETDKVFTVDPKRPAAGTLASTLTWGTDNSATAGGLDNSQYFASIVNNIKDETIVDVTAALNTLMPTLRGLSTDAAADAAALAKLKSLNNQLILESRTVAWKRFDLDEPGFEHLVAEFVAQHMNCCNTCENYSNTNTFYGPATPPAPAPAPAPAPVAPAPVAPAPVVPESNGAGIDNDSGARSIVDGAGTGMPFAAPSQPYLELTPTMIR